MPSRVQTKRRTELENEAAQLLQRISRWSATETEMAAQRQQAAMEVAESERLRKETLEQLRLKVLSPLCPSLSFRVLSNNLRR